jgi:hypothetical protein
MLCAVENFGCGSEAVAPISSGIVQLNQKVEQGVEERKSDNIKSRSSCYGFVLRSYMLCISYMERYYAIEHL